MDSRDFEVEPVGYTFVPGNMRFGIVSTVPDAVALAWLKSAVPDAPVADLRDWSSGRAFVIQSDPLVVTALQRSFRRDCFWLIQKGRPNSVVHFEGQHYSVFRVSDR